jgi:recombination protein RecT
MTDKPQASSAQITPKFTFEQLLNSEKFQRDVAKVLPKTLTPQRMVQTALNALNRNPKLRECSQSSFFAALMKLSEVGLEPDSYHAHLIPFRNNKLSITECQLIIDYKGLITVIRRNPAISVVKGACVYEGDEFEYQEGSDRYFHHRPKFQNERIVGAYSYVKFANINDWEIDYLPLWRIEEVRSRSRAKDSGPWVTDFAEMAIKTAMRHHAKTLPLLPEQRAVVTADDDQYGFDPFSRKPALPQRPAEFKKKEDPENVPESEPTALQSTQVGNATAVQQQSAEDDIPMAGEPLSPKPGEHLVTLEKIAEKYRILPMEVINELVEHKYQVGDAAESGELGDLPLESILDAIRMFEAIVFSVTKKRKAGAK